MNADELRKEAERVGKILIYGELEDAKALELLQEVFRAVHNAAIEKAAHRSKQAVAQHDDWMIAHGRGWDLVGEQTFIANEIRALKIGDGE